MGFPLFLSYIDIYVCMFSRFPYPVPPPYHFERNSNSAMRKINELVKRTRLLRVHACIIGYLKEQMPMFMGREKMQVRPCSGRHTLSIYKPIDGGTFWFSPSCSP
jgi:hypothetical protein